MSTGIRDNGRLAVAGRACRLLTSHGGGTDSGFRSTDNPASPLGNPAAYSPAWRWPSITPGSTTPRGRSTRCLLPRAAGRRDVRFIKPPSAARAAAVDYLRTLVRDQHVPVLARVQSIYRPVNPGGPLRFGRDNGHTVLVVGTFGNEDFLIADPAYGE